jgi:hypothetical protein
VKRQLLPFLGVLVSLACGGPDRPPKGPPQPTPAGSEHLLYEPTGNASGLLGRAVTMGPDGQLVIAEELAPGCHVTMREVQSSWTRTYAEDIGNIAFASASIPVIGNLRGQYGSQIRTHTKITNQKELVADLSGPCGELVIKTVKVGTGSRDLQYRREASASGDVSAYGVGVRGGDDDWERIGQSLKWDYPQAWAFTVSKFATAESVRLSIEMPTELTDGDQYTIRVSSTQQVWVIAFYEEADGTAGILLPNQESPNVVVTSEQRKSLPTMRVSLSNPAVASREKIVLYAFTKKQDYEDFRPPAGAVSEADATAYYRGLSERLSKLPRRRWAVGEMAYVIKPRGAGP